MFHFSLQDIEEVIFSGHFQTAWKAIMHLLPNVKSVTYTECCNDDVLRSIAQHCPKLEMLNVNFSRNVTDDGIAHFLPVVKRKRRRKIGWCPTGREYLPCPLLTKIHLQYTDVSVGGIITLLEKLPLLEILDSLELPMVLQRIYKEQLFTPRKLNLTHLSLSFHTRNYYDSYEDIFKACVILCPNLKTVSLSVNKLKQLDLCFLLPDATDLDLCFCSRHSTTAGLNDFLKSQGRKITRLTFLHGTTVPLSVLVQYCRRLKELRMEGVSVECDGNGSTETFNNLKVFSVQLNDLWNSSNCEAICRVLESSPVLEKLLLELNTFPAQLKNAILKCCAQAPLRCIDLHEIGNDKKFIRNVLSTCSTLRTFVLYGNNICSS